MDIIQTKVFPISSFLLKFLPNKNYLNSTTCNDIDMKLWPLFKLIIEIRPCKKLDDVVMSSNIEVFLFFPICGQFEAIQKPHSWFLDHNKITNFYPIKNTDFSKIKGTLPLWNKLLKISTRSGLMGEFKLRNFKFFIVTYFILISHSFWSFYCDALLLCHITVHWTKSAFKNAMLLGKLFNQ